MHLWYTLCLWCTEWTSNPWREQDETLSLWRALVVYCRRGRSHQANTLQSDLGTINIISKLLVFLDSTPPKVSYLLCEIRFLTNEYKIPRVGVFGTVPVFLVPAWMSYRTYRSVRYQYWCHTELTEVSGTGIDAVPSSPKCPVPVLMLYRIYRNVQYRYWCRTELTEVSGTGMKVCTGTKSVPVPPVPVSISYRNDRVGIDVVPKLPKCPVPVLMSYRTYRSVRCR